MTHTKNTQGKTMTYNTTQPDNTFGPFSIDGQPVKTKIIKGLTWDAVVELHWHSAGNYPTIWDATGSAIDWDPKRMKFSKIIETESIKLQTKFANAGYVLDLQAIMNVITIDDILGSASHGSWVEADIIDEKPCVVVCTQNYCHGNHNKQVAKEYRPIGA